MFALLAAIAGSGEPSRLPPTLESRLLPVAARIQLKRLGYGMHLALLAAGSSPCQLAGQGEERERSLVVLESAGMGQLPDSLAPMRIVPAIVGSAVGLGLGVAAGSAWCNPGGCIDQGGDDPGLTESILLGGVGAVLGGAVGACLGQMSGSCLAEAVPKSGIGSLVGLLTGGALVAFAEGSGLLSNRPAFVLGFAVGHALALKWLWD